MNGMSPDEKWEAACSLSKAEAMSSGRETLTVLSTDMTPEQALVIRPHCLPWIMVRIHEHVFLVGFCDSNMRPCRWWHMMSRSYRIAVWDAEGTLLMSGQPTEPRPLWRYRRDSGRKHAFTQEFIRVLAEGPCHE